MRDRKKDGKETWRVKRKITLRIEDACARLFPVQTYLLDEFLAQVMKDSKQASPHG